MKKKKEYNVFVKIRGALRDIYRYSPMRKEAIKAATIINSKPPSFDCKACDKRWPIQMADVDHEPALGALSSFLGPHGDLGSWTMGLFHGSVQVICKICHKKKTASQRKKKKV